MFLRAPVIVLSIALFGLYEATMLALLPIWGVRVGFTPRLAAASVSAVFIGSISLQWPIGWLSDHAPRSVTLRLCGAAALAGSLVLVVFARPVPSFLAVLGIWGGIASAIYPVALSMAGDRFRGSELVSINAALIIAYGIGGIVGPGLGGLAMDRWDPQGLPTFFALLFAVFLGVSLAPFWRSGWHSLGMTTMIGAFIRALWR
jgi:MFS family permease